MKDGFLHFVSGDMRFDATLVRVIEEELISDYYMTSPISPAKNPAIQKYFSSYIAQVNRYKEDLEKIRDTKKLEFKNTRDDREEKSNISYFWVPIDKLP